MVSPQYLALSQIILLFKKSMQNLPFCTWHGIISASFAVGAIFNKDFGAIRSQSCRILICTGLI